MVALDKGSWGFALLSFPSPQAPLPHREREKRGETSLYRRPAPQAAQIWALRIKLQGSCLRQPGGSSDLPKFTGDFAPGIAGVLANIYFPEQAKGQNAIGIRGMCREAPDS